MSEKAQRRQLSLLVMAIFLVLDRPLKKLVAEQVPKGGARGKTARRRCCKGWRGWSRSSSPRPSCGDWPSSCSGGDEALTATRELGLGSFDGLRL